MVVADSCQAWAGGGAAAGSASRRTTGLAEGGVIARAAFLALRWESVWRRGCGACGGARDLVGAAAGLAGEDSRNPRQPNQRPRPPNLARPRKHRIRAAKLTPIGEQETQLAQ